MTPPVTVETVIFTTLRHLVNDRVFQNVSTTPPPTPYITYQLAGGAAVNFLDTTLPSKRNSRWQIDVWSTLPSEVASLSHQIEDHLRMAAALQTTVLGAATGSYEGDTKLHGRRQDFSFWF